MSLVNTVGINQERTCDVCGKAIPAGSMAVKDRTHNKEGRRTKYAHLRCQEKVSEKRRIA